MGNAPDAVWGCEGVGRPVLKFPLPLMDKRLLISGRFLPDGAVFFLLRFGRESDDSVPLPVPGPVSRGAYRSCPG